MKAHRLVPGGSYTHLAQALWNQARVGLICKAIWQQKQNTLQLQTKFGRCQLLRAICSGRKLKSGTSDSVCCLWRGVAHSLKRASLTQRQCRNGRERAPNLHERESWRLTQLPIDHVAKNRAVEYYNCCLHMWRSCCSPLLIEQDLKPGHNVGTREIFMHNYSNTAENFCFKYIEHIQALRWNFPLWTRLNNVRLIGSNHFLKTSSMARVEAFTREGEPLRGRFSFVYQEACFVLGKA